ncbi:MAG: ribonuclease HII [Bacillales bacterium]
MLNYEINNLDEEINFVLGIDEAGRGPLCGPLVVAGVVFPKSYQNELINDSKKLSVKKREHLFNIIKNDALFYEIKIIDPSIIDKLNIYQATKKAMEEIIINLKDKVDYILTDAMKVDIKDINYTPLVKGDSKAITIAAASILAKVTRDNIMDELNIKYPEYQFSKHKGYPTKLHLEILNKYGPIKSIYRFSYKPLKNK